MRALSLFSGIGGIDLAAEWAGIETVAMCEKDPFCQRVLKKHWPIVPIYDDVCTLTRARLDTDGIGTIELIFGGYPCQPFSVAGKREGEDDNRHLWPEVFRLLQEIEPNWFVGENVAGHVTLGLDRVLSDLANIGYTTQPFVIPAASVGAPHRRDRVFIVSHSNRIGWNHRLDNWEKRYFQNDEERDGSENKPKWHGWLDRFRETGSTIPNTASIGQPRQRELIQPIYTTQNVDGKTNKSFDVRIRGQWEVEPDVGRVVDGSPGELDEDRLRALGNAVVPQQIYPVLAAIKQIDDMLKEKIA